MMVQRAVCFLFAMTMSGVVLNQHGAAQQTPSSQSVQSATHEQHETWRKAMKSITRPKKGCFKATYPNMQWQELSCGVAPNVPYAPPSKIQRTSSRGGKSETVGDSDDFFGEVTSGQLTSADGSFPTVVGLESYSSYSIQTNSNFFSDPPACSGAANAGSCSGWQQFVYSSTTNQVFMQYWLINYQNACPTGWNAYGSDCYVNSVATSVPSQNLGDLPFLTMTGQAVLNGNDSAMLDTANSGLFTTEGEDNMLQLASFWTGAEFNIFGDCCSDQVNFNSGTTFTVQTSLDNGTTNAPICSTSGTTAETNNLSLAPTSSPVCCPYGGSSPSIQFMESNASGASASCGVSGLETDIAAAPTTSDGKETQITHPVFEGEIRTQYSATLLDSTPGATIYYQLFNSCGQVVDSGSGSSGLSVSFIGVYAYGEGCPLDGGTTGPVSGTMYATAPQYVQSGTTQILF